MPFDLQPTLQNQWITLRPLREDDFDALYLVASDPLIWEQHPSRTRYQRDVFENYFKGAIESRGALLILDQQTTQILGSSRYYDWDESRRQIAIGYTFIARSHWGRNAAGINYNRQLKTLMLDHAFQYADAVLFHVGVDNVRSRMAMQKLGAVLIGEEAVAYYGEATNQNVVFRIERAAWAQSR